MRNNHVFRIQKFLTLINFFMVDDLFAYGDSEKFVMDMPNIKKMILALLLII